MGKITVKHYLNTSLKHNESINDVVKYPVYLQITANRKTTKLKSLTGKTLTENEFKEYELLNKQNKKFTSEIIEISNEFLKEVIFEELKGELKTVIDIIDYCVNTKNIEVGKLKLKPVIEFYSKLIQSEFGKHIYNLNLFPALIENEKTAPIAMFIESEINPLSFIETFKSVAKFDIMQILNTEQKENILAFDLFVNLATEIELEKLINWYNGSINSNFIKKVSTNDDVNPFKIIDYIDSFAKILENNLLLELKYTTQ